MKKAVLFLVVVFIVAVAAYFFVTRSQPLVTKPEPAKLQAPVVQKPKVIVKPAPESKAPQHKAENARTLPKVAIEVERAPTLNDSDQQAQAVLKKLSPALLQWFNQDELVRKAVIAIDRVASGELPNNYLPLRYARAAFKVTPNNVPQTQDDARYTAADENHARFKPLLSALYFIEPATFAAYYHDWLPIFEQAYAEMGAKGTFNLRFHQALQQVLSAPEIADKPVLVQPHVLYEYQNKQLEAANGVHKFVWRLGNENRRNLQRYLSNLQQELQLRAANH